MHAAHFVALLDPNRGLRRGGLAGVRVPAFQRLLAADPYVRIDRRVAQVGEEVDVAALLNLVDVGEFAAGQGPNGLGLNIINVEGVSSSACRRLAAVGCGRRSLCPRGFVLAAIVSLGTALSGST